MMKRQITLVVLALAILLTLPMTAFAARGDSGAKLGYVTDYYGLLNSNELSFLENKAALLSEQYGCSLYIVIVKDYRDYAGTTFRYAQDLFTTNNLGWGADKNGVMLMLSMADRDYELMFHPDSTMDVVFCEYARDEMIERFLPYFRNNSYADGFSAYLDGCEWCLKAYQEGNPIRQPEQSLKWLAPLIGAAAALITGFVMYAPMKSAVQKHEASEYIDRHSIDLSVRTDVFLHRTVHRVPRETSSSSSSGSSHHSGGFSGRSGKF